MAEKELTFEQQQAAAYAFLDAFYNKADFGYDVKYWKPENVNQAIIDIVNQMGNDIYTNTRVVTIASEVFKEVAQMLIGGGIVVKLLTAPAIKIIVGDFNKPQDISTSVTKQLVEEKNRYRKNNLAWAVVTQVMAREKGNIELAFLGFI